MNTSTPSLADTFANAIAAEWRKFWLNRMALYWSLGKIDPAEYWRL